MCGSLCGLLFNIPTTVIFHLMFTHHVVKTSSKTRMKVGKEKKKTRIYIFYTWQIFAIVDDTKKKKRKKQTNVITPGFQIVCGEFLCCLLLGKLFLIRMCGYVLWIFGLCMDKRRWIVAKLLFIMEVDLKAYTGINLTATL